VKSLLASGPVLWFLFLFALGLGLTIGVDQVAASLGLHGIGRVLISGMLALISLGAGANLLRRRLPALHSAAKESS